VGKVYDVNGYLITSELISMGFNVEYKGIYRDDYELLLETLSRDIKNYDIIVTSGGTSKGLGDVVYRVFNDLGQPGVVIHGLKIKPGKPTVFAIVDNKLLIGLPGFPLSCFMVFNIIVKPILYRLIGLKNYSYRKILAELSLDIRKQPGLTWFIPVALIAKNNRYIAYPATLTSGSIYSFIASDGILILGENLDMAVKGREYEVFLLKDLEHLPKLVIIGSNDVLLYTILKINGLENYTRVISVGSIGGLNAIRSGEADIAPIHLYDPDTNTYNKPFIDMYGLRDKAVLIRGYDRLIGIITAKGNPKKILSINDFLRDDVIIVNRSRGTGIRQYLDHLLSKLSRDLNIEMRELVMKIKGYTYEVKTHTAIATAIKLGRADAGLAICYVAKLYDLECIPLTWEQYDFLILRDSLNKDYVIKFINSLKEIRTLGIIEEIKDYYRIPDDIGERYY